jgi:hypothetical protein
VTLASSNPSVANPVAASIVVPQGVASATFSVNTNQVGARTTATISGTANTITKSAILTITPAAVISPTSLKFASVPVNSASGAQNVTLSNKGTVDFAINGISLTGTYSSWFVQTNDCPASLPAGQSCTFAVTFQPRAAGSKTAKLTVTTSAATAPLNVSLSGTGI